MEIRKASSTKEMVMTALMTALVFLAGSVIKVPTVGGFVHIGDCMVFLSVVIIGKKKGALASSVGMFLVDVSTGYYVWAPFTFLIKFIMAYITGFLIERINKGNDFIVEFDMKYVYAFIAGGVFMIAGYFIAGGIIAAFFTGHIGLIEGFAVSAKDIIGNIVQVVTGIILSIPLSVILIKAKKSIL